MRELGWQKVEDYFTESRRKRDPPQRRNRHDPARQRICRQAIKWPLTARGVHGEVGEESERPARS